MKRTWVWLLATSIAVAAPMSALAVDIPVPAKIYLVKQDKNAGYVGSLAKVVNKPSSGTFALPGSAPTAVGATLKFFKVGTPGVWEDLNLPAGQWIGLGNPAGSKGYKYRGTGSLTDPCKSVLIKTKVIKATCKGANSTDSPSPYSIPVNQALGAAWELVIGADRYCAESSTATAAQVKKNDGAKGLYKSIKSNAPLLCPNAIAPTPPPPTSTPTPTPTPPYGSASKAFLNPAKGLLE